MLATARGSEPLLRPNYGWKEVSLYPLPVIACRGLLTPVRVNLTYVRFIADRIAVFEDGEIIACAPHRELIESCPEYERMFRIQKRKFGSCIPE